MATDQVIIEFDGRDRGVASVARNVRSELDHMGRSVKGGASTLDDFTRSTEKSTGALGGFLKSAGAVAGGILGAQALGGAINFIKDSVIGAGFAFNTLKEQATIAFTTMLGDGEKAQAFLKELEDFAAHTPFEFPDLLQTTQRLMAMGFAAEDVIPTMTAIGDAVAGMGGSAEMLNRVTTALGQMLAKGKVSGEEMRQLAESGIPAWQYLADEIGVSIPEAMKLAEKGSISAAQGISAITKGMSADFGGMMEQQSKTFQGMLSTLKDTWRSISAQIMKPFFTLATQGLGALNKFLSNGMLQRGAEKLAAGIEAIVRGVKNLVSEGGALNIFATRLALAMGVPYGSEKLIGFWGTLKAIFEQVVTLLRSELLPALVPVWEQLKLLGEAFSDLWAVLGPILMPVLKELGKELGQALLNALPLIVDGLVLLIRALTIGVEKLTEFIRAIKAGDESATRWGEAIAVVVGFIGGLWALNAVANAILGTGRSIVTAWQGFVSTLKAVNAVLNPLAGATRQIADNFAKIVSKTVTLTIRGLQAAWGMTRDIARFMANAAGKTVSFTVQAIQKGTAMIMDFADKVQQIVQKIVRTGDEWIHDFADKVQNIYQRIHAQSEKTAEDKLTQEGESLGKSFASKFIQGVVFGLGTALAAALVAALSPALVAGVAAAIVALPVGLAAAITGLGIMLAPLILAALVAGFAIANPDAAGQIAGIITGMIFNAAVIALAILPYSLAKIFLQIMKTSLIDIPKGLSGDLIKMFTDIGSQGSRLIQQIIAGDWGGAARTALGILKTIFIQFPLDVLDTIRDGLGDVVGEFAAAGSRILAQLGIDTSGWKEAISSAMGSIWETVVSRLGDIWSKFTEILGNIGAGIKNWLGEFVSNWGASFMETTEGTRTRMKEIAEDILNKLGEIKDKGSQIFGAFGDKLGDIAGGIKSKLISIFLSIVNGITGMINALLGMVNNVTGAINDLLEFTVSFPGVNMPDPIPDIPGFSQSFDLAPDIPQIPLIGGVASPEGGSNLDPGFLALAEGGIVRRPTFALIGEAGPEAVVPLSKMGNNRPTIVNVYIDGKKYVGEVVRTEIEEATNRMALDAQQYGIV